MGIIVSDIYSNINHLSHFSLFQYKYVYTKNIRATHAKVDMTLNTPEFLHISTCISSSYNLTQESPK